MLAYLVYRSRGQAAQAAPATSDTASAPPAPPSTGTGGQSADQAATADLLAALAGENQELIKSFLASEQGLVSLAGSSIGAPQTSGSTSMATATPVAEPTPSLMTAPAPVAAAPTISAAAAPVSEPLYATPVAAVPATGYSSVSYAPTGEVYTPVSVGLNEPSLEPKPTGANVYQGPYGTTTTYVQPPPASAEAVTAHALAAQGGVGQKALK
ncbi:MAG TPA: hypothetical protein VFA88_06700 [Gaiellaceae bacterium]|nr:hypothetical protein [Gaiellaceae bacterium]